MDSIDALKQVVEELLEGTDQFVIDVEWKVSSRRLVVLIDADSGITTDHLARLTRDISAYLEEADGNWEAYTLEVSSPGLDRPLSSLRQYKKNVGRQVRIQCKNLEIIQGKILSVEEHAVHLKTKKAKQHLERTIAFEDIEQTHVLPG